MREPLGGEQLGKAPTRRDQQRSQAKAGTQNEATTIDRQHHENSGN
jgi:hypothetical protein